MSADEVRVSGTVILDQIEILNEIYGAPVVEKARGLIPTAHRAELELLLRGSWCSTAAAASLKNAIADLVGVKPLELQRRVVKLAIERTLNTLWRFLMRQLSDQQLARRAPILYSKSFNRGQLEFKGWRPGGAELELKGWPQMPEYDLVGLMTAIETVFVLAGRKDPRCAYTRRSDAILLEATWQK
jgi:hypothetical protein